MTLLSVDFDFVSGLPPEIVGTIFCFCLADGDQRGLPSSRRAPLLLTHICRSWRDFAHGTPSLWSELSLKRITEATKEHLHLKFLGEWLGRSGGLPLVLRFSTYMEEIMDIYYHSGSFRYTEESFGAAREIVNALEPYASRCEELDAELFPDMYGMPEWVSLISKMHNLRAVSCDDHLVGYYGQFPEYAGELSFQVLPDEPKHLRRLILPVFTPEYLPVPYRDAIPWSQLTTLHLKFDQREDYQRIISACASLDDLTVRVYYITVAGWMETGSDEFARSASLPRLPRLSLILEIDESQLDAQIDILTTPYPFIDTISFPTTLSVNQKAYLPHVTNLLVRSHTRELRLPEFPPRWTLHLLKSAPELEVLEVDLQVTVRGEWPGYSKLWRDVFSVSSSGSPSPDPILSSNVSHDHLLRMFASYDLTNPMMEILDAQADITEERLEFARSQLTVDMDEATLDRLRQFNVIFTARDTVRFWK